MGQAAEALLLGEHDDDCAFRKGKECGCKDNLRALAAGELEELERLDAKWNRVVYRKPTIDEWSAGHKTSVATAVPESATLVRVDNGKVVSKTIADPLSPRNPPITIHETLPPRWVCLECAASQRGTDVDHRCDDAVKSRAKRPIGLERTIPIETRFGGDYRLTLWRDKSGEYHLGEEVVQNGRVVEERHLYGPESYNVIEGAILDAAVSKLTP